MKNFMIKKLILSIILCLNNVVLSQSTNWIWANKIQSNTNYIQGGAVCVNSLNQAIYSGEFYNTITIGTTTHNATSSLKSALIIKNDVMGLPIWSKSFGPFNTSGSINYITISDIEVNSAGEIFALGSFSNNISFDGNTLNGTGKVSMYIIKLDGNGNYLWGKSFSSGQRIIPEDLHIDNNGIYITGAFTGSQMVLGTFTLANNMTLNGTEYEDIFITKLDLNGNVLWAKTNVSFQGGRESGKSVVTNTIGDVYIAGDMKDGGTTTFGTYTLNSPSGSSGDDIFVIKYDSNGNEQWAKKANSSNIDLVASIVIDYNGNPTIIGNYYGSAFSAGTNTILNSGSSTSDVFAANISPSGNFNWLKKVTNNGGDDIASGAAMDNNNVTSIIGKFSGGNIVSGGSTLTPAGGTDMFLIKLNSSGSDVLAARAGANFLDDGSSVAVDNNNDVYVTGQYAFNISFGSLPVLPGSFSATNYLAKLSDGLITNLINFESARIKLYPNPANSFLRVDGFDVNNEFTLSIINTDGKKIYSKQIHTSLLDISSLLPGVYNLIINDSKGNTSTHRFIKE